jgi:hypothetical protein
MTASALTPADEVALTAALHAWRDSGNPNPLIPTTDLDGDGLNDAWGLDADGLLILVPGVAVEDTVSESTGGGIETDRTEPDHG